MNLKEIERAARDICDIGHSRIIFPVDAQVNPVIVGWRSFVQESDAFKNQWNVDERTGQPDPDNGYVARAAEQKDDGTAYDRKEFFHYRPTLWGRLRRLGVDFSRYSAWLSDCDELYQACVDRIILFAESLDKVRPGFGFLDKALEEAATRSHVLRLLYYVQAQKEGEELAKFHTDRCFLTLHIAESHPGLVLRTKEGDMPYVVEEDRVLVFPGKKFGMLTEGRPTGLAHGVICPPQIAGGEQRISCVFFSHINQPL